MGVKAWRNKGFKLTNAAQDARYEYWHRHTKGGGGICLALGPPLLSVRGSHRKSAALGGGDCEISPSDAAVPAGGRAHKHPD